MSNVTNDDRHLATLYRTYLRMGNEPGAARAMAMGREMSSVAMFDEAIARVDAEVLAMSETASLRESLVSMGSSDSSARAQALDHGWELIDEARRRERIASAVGDAGTEDLLVESFRGMGLSLDQAREAADEWEADEAARTGRPRVRRFAKPTAPRTQELREVGDGGANLVESFRRMGLSEEQAREATKGH